jgi:predicted metal-dependent hydrolase
MTERSIAYGTETIRYRIVKRKRRRTLGIEVHPDGTVLALRPTGCSDEQVAAKVNKRASWISRKLQYFQQFTHASPTRHYLSGESHRFLGRQYRLRILGTGNGSNPKVTVTRNEILVQAHIRPNPMETRRLLESWYLRQAKNVFASLLDENFSQFQKHGHERPKLTVRSMQTRWGSLSESGQMTLNPRLMQAPKPCIEYVIVHELCHLMHKDHSPEFWYLLSKVMPDWQERKQKLEESLLG